MVNEEEEKTENMEQDKENVEMISICGTLVPSNQVVGSSSGATGKVDPDLSEQKVIKCFP